MLPQIEAEETLLAAGAVALGSGTIAKGAAREFRADLQRAADSGRRTVRGGGPQERLAAAARLGIEVIRGN